MIKQEQVIEDIVDMFFAQKVLYQRMTGEYVDRKNRIDEKKKFIENIKKGSQP